MTTHARDITQRTCQFMGRRTLRLLGVGLAVIGATMTNAQAQIWQRAPVDPSGLTVVRKLTTGGGGPSTYSVTTESLREHDFGSFGDNDFGGSAGVSTKVRRTHSIFSATPSNYKASSAVRGDVKIFGNALEAARVGVDAENAPYGFDAGGAFPLPNYKPSATVFVNLAGFAVFEDTYTSSLLEKSWVQEFGPYDTPHVSATFSILGVPITVAAWAGANAKLALTVRANVNALNFEVVGTAGATAFGRATAGVGVSWASAGIALTVYFGSPTVALSLTSSLNTGNSFVFQACKTAFHVAVSLYATVTVLRRDFYKEKTLFSWSTPQECHTLNL